MFDSIPTVSDIDLATFKFLDGDRLIVRFSQDVSPDKLNALTRSVKKFCKADVKLLFVNCLRMSLYHRTADRLFNLVDARHANLDVSKRLVNLEMSIIDIAEDDVLYAVVDPSVTLEQRHYQKDYIKNWAGDVEVVIGDRDFIGMSMFSQPF